jgi:hypothetical protein
VTTHHALCQQEGQECHFAEDFGQKEGGGRGVREGGCEEPNERVCDVADSSDHEQEREPPGEHPRPETEQAEGEEPQPGELGDQVSVVLQIHQEEDQRAGAVDAEGHDVRVVGRDEQRAELVTMFMQVMAAETATNTTTARAGFGPRGPAAGGGSLRGPATRAPGPDRRRSSAGPDSRAPPGSLPRGGIACDVDHHAHDLGERAEDRDSEIEQACHTRRAHTRVHEALAIRARSSLRRRCSWGISP